MIELEAMRSMILFEDSIFSCTVHPVFGDHPKRMMVFRDHNLFEAETIHFCRESLLEQHLFGCVQLLLLDLKANKVK